MEKNIFIDLVAIHNCFYYKGNYDANNSDKEGYYTLRKTIITNFINIAHNNGINIYVFVDARYDTLYRDNIYNIKKLDILHIKDIFMISGDINDTKIFKFVTGKHFNKSMILYHSKPHTNGIKTIEFSPEKYILIDNFYNTIYKIFKYFSIKYDKELLNMNIKYNTREESIVEYRKYVDAHISNVIEAYGKYRDIINNYISERNSEDLSHYQMNMIDIKNHDKSKYSDDELYPYAAKFYTSKEDDISVIRQNFDLAWKHHYTNNKHHPEYWVCRSKLTGENIITRMDNASFAEMLYDWIAMSMNFKQRLYDWWFNNDGGRKEKNCLLSVEDVILLDKIITETKDLFDFRKTK